MKLTTELLLTRRAFGQRSGVVAGAALLASLPAGSPAFAERVLQWGVVPPLDTGRDEALGNYPAYAEAIPAGRRAVPPVAAPVSDGQLLT